MREIRQSGSEGGGTGTTGPPYPIPQHGAFHPAAPAPVAPRSHVVCHCCGGSRIHRLRSGRPSTRPPSQHGTRPPPAPAPGLLFSRCMRSLPRPSRSSPSPSPRPGACRPPAAPRRLPASRARARSTPCSPPGRSPTGSTPGTNAREQGPPTADCCRGRYWDSRIRRLRPGQASVGRSPHHDACPPAAPASSAPRSHVV